MDRDESMRRNRQTDGSWETFRSHRDQITRWIESLVQRSSSAREKRRLAVLGAGNTNDLDLARLSDLFDEVVLLDWDADAVRAGIERQKAMPQHAEPVAGKDRWSRIIVGPSLDLSENSAKIRSLGKFGVVASIGLLSQIIELSLSRLADQKVDDPTDVADSLDVTRRKHFSVVSDLMGSASSAFVTTEFVSSQTLPALRTQPESQWGPLLRDALLEGNFFSGTQPASVLDSARTVFGRRDRTVQPTAPWRWDFGPRIYAVVGYVVTSSKEFA